MSLKALRLRQRRHAAKWAATIVAALAAGLPSTATAFTDAEITAHLRQRFSCSLLSPTEMTSGTVRGVSGPVQAFRFGAEGCPGLGFEGVTFGVVLSEGGRLTLLVPRPAPNAVSGVAIRDGRVVATSYAWKPGDPSCCPSASAVVRWGISSGALVRAP